MPDRPNIPQRLTALLVYGRPPLVFAGLVCAVAVMWTRNPSIYLIGISFLLVSMSFDMIDGWFAARFPPHPTLADLADRIMDKIVYSTIFPLVAVGMMWRLVFIVPGHSRPEMLHALLVLALCITVLVRDNLAQFMRGCAIQKGFEPETREFTRLRTMVAAPVGALLYIHAFFLPGKGGSPLYNVVSWLADLPLRSFFIIEIIFLIINFGSIAALARRYGTSCLDEVCHEDDALRRRILALLPNSLTVLNALMGMLAVLFTYHGLIRQAYLFLIGAAFFDKLDGALARKLGLTEPAVHLGNRPRLLLGSILDDIADAISFCLGPALIFFLVLARYHNGPLTGELQTGAVAAIYFLTGVTRLIYFTMDRAPIPGFFKGLPTPAAALLVVAPLLLFRQAQESALGLVRFWASFSYIILLAASLVMNLYPVHYLHLGRFMDKHPWFGNLNILLLLVSMFTPYFGYIALVYLLLYLLSPLVTWKLEPSINK